MRLGFRQFDQEMKLSERLKEYSAIFSGSTDPNIRRERSRAAILANNLADETIPGTSETYAQMFERIYREGVRKP